MEQTLIAKKQFKFKVHVFYFQFITFLFFLAFLLNRTTDKGFVKLTASIFGFTGLLSLLFILALPLLKKWSKKEFLAKLLANRRWLGIYTFIIICVHFINAVTLITNLPINKQPNFFFVGFGALAFFILFLMAITSNNEAVAALGKNWKKLHNLIYLAVPLIILHSSNVGMLVMKQPIIRNLVVLLAIIIIAIKKLKFKKKNR